MQTLSDGKYWYEDAYEVMPPCGKCGGAFEDHMVLSNQTSHVYLYVGSR